MDQAKQQQLAAKGWKVGSVEEFLELAPEEVSYIELKLALSESLRIYRKQRQLTQTDLAALLKIRQSNCLVFRDEKGDRDGKLIFFIIGDGFVNMGFAPIRCSQ